MQKILLLIIIVLFTITHSWSQKSEDNFMNNWHLSASKADFNSYFDAMDESFVFLGTAPGERWTKEQFSLFSKPYFDKGKAWDFKASNRKWTYSSNRKIAWFDEDLDTWMRSCRGTGILVKERGEWKLIYYNLHVLIENEKMTEFIELRDKKL